MLFIILIWFYLLSGENKYNEKSSLSLRHPFGSRKKNTFSITGIVGSSSGSRGGGSFTLGSAVGAHNAPTFTLLQSSTLNGIFKLELCVAPTYKKFIKNKVGKMLNKVFIII